MLNSLEADLFGILVIFFSLDNTFIARNEYITYLVKSIPTEK